MPHARCSKCNGRRTLARAPAEYQRVPPCLRCGVRMTDQPPGSHQAHWKLDHYRRTKERGAHLTCDPSKTGCRGYSHLHRHGSGFCCFNPKLTDDDHRERHERGNWS